MAGYVSSWTTSHSAIRYNVMSFVQPVRSLSGGIRSTQHLVRRKNFCPGVLRLVGWPVRVVSGGTLKSSGSVQRLQLRLESSFGVVVVDFESGRVAYQVRLQLQS